MIKQHAVTLDFIGGEPLLEIELIDKICDYFKLKHMKWEFLGIGITELVYVLMV